LGSRSTHAVHSVWGGSHRGLRTQMPTQEETVFDYPWVALCLVSWALAMLIWVTIE
jgi:hypothetical protein